MGRLVTELVLAGLSALLLILLSTIESAYEQISDVSMRILRGESRSSREVFFTELMENRERFHMTLLLGIQVMVVAIACLAVHITLGFDVPHPVMVAFGCAIPVVVFCRTMLPRLVSQGHPEKVLIGFMPLFKPYYRVAGVVALPLVKIVEALRRNEDDVEEFDDEISDVTMSDIQAFLDVGAEEGIIEESEGLMIQSIVEFGDRVVHEVMTPRTQMVTVEASATVIEARDLMVSSKHSRLPVYRGQDENIEGVVYVRDLLGAWADGRESAPVTGVMRSAYFIPEVKPVADLLEEMRKSKVQIALVIDEYGAIAGLVTIEDLLEEIVGEIEDEDEMGAGDDDLVADGDGSFLVKGSTEIRKLEIEYDTELEADDFTTVAGLVINELGHLPTPGERLEFKGLEFEVLEADNRRVNLVRLRRLPEHTADAAHDASHNE